MKRIVLAGILGLAFIWSQIWEPSTAFALVNNTVVYKVSVTIPEHVQTQSEQQVSNDQAYATKKEKLEIVTEEVVRNHEKVILRTIVTK